MKGKRMPRRKKLLLAGGIVLLVLAVLTGAFFWYVSDYYPADEIALEVLAQDSTIEVQDDLTILSPSYPTDTAVIFYPGAKVEAEAYLPLLEQIRQTGVTCILVHMPFRMAIFDANAAEDVMEQFPDIQRWYIAGHSMGGSPGTRRSILLTVRTGSNTRPACMSPRPRSSWNGWNSLSVCGTRLTLCPKSRAAVWMPASFLARPILK